MTTGEQGAAGSSPPRGRGLRGLRKRPRASPPARASRPFCCALMFPNYKETSGAFAAPRPALGTPGAAQVLVPVLVDHAPRSKTAVTGITESKQLCHL